MPRRNAAYLDTGSSVDGPKGSRWLRTRLGKGGRSCCWLCTFRGMTYVIAEPCVDVLDRTCVDVCPVDCIYEGSRALYIQPEECIDCGACEPVCPVLAVYYDGGADRDALDRIGVRLFWRMSALEEHMDTLDLNDLVDELIAGARSASSGRSARTVHGGNEHALRQTVIALASGHGLDEHESPGEATLQVLRGHVRLNAGGEGWEGVAGGYLVIPPQRHSVEALEDSAILLTVAVG